MKRMGSRWVAGGMLCSMALAQASQAGGMDPVLQCTVRYASEVWHLSSRATVDPYRVPLTELAEREHVSSRTLIRKLRDEGLTYQQLLDRVREDLACWWLLHTDLSVEAIADRLGYQDTSNFSRTFRRWVGMTPRDFRQSTERA